MKQSESAAKIEKLDRVCQIFFEAMEEILEACEMDGDLDYIQTVAEKALEDARAIEHN